eukprot:6001456-Heterocapsa_arctica.AAC.1
MLPNSSAACTASCALAGHSFKRPSRALPFGYGGTGIQTTERLQPLAQRNEIVVVVVLVVAVIRRE